MGTDEIGATTRIYLDHAATTPVRPEALEAMIACLKQPGNPSSLHSWGRLARETLDRARDAVASALGSLNSEIIFTSGGTESDNLAVIGGALSASGRRHVLVSAVEHHAVLHAAQSLTAEGYEVETIPVDSFARVEVSEVAARLRPDTALVSVMLANNETGVLQPVSAVSALCRSNGTLLHTDAVQAFAHSPVSPMDLGVDLLSISGHKFGGPVGAGALWVREGVEIRPTLFGGAQERGRRGGTENVAAIAGMEAALHLLIPRIEEEALQERTLVSRLRGRLRTLSGVWFNTPEEGALPGILNVGFKGRRAETLLLALDLAGIAASSGSACASGSIDPSHVLRASGLTDQDARSSIRFSLGWTTTAADVDEAAAVIERLVTR